MSSTQTTSRPVEDDAASADVGAARSTRRTRSGRGRGRSTWQTTLRYAGMPVFLGLVLLGLWLYVTGQELDSVEQRGLVAADLWQRTLEHLTLSLLSTIAVLLLAVPLGIAATRPGRRRLAVAIIGLGNAGQAIPSLGMLGLLFFAFREVDAISSTGTVPVVIALTAYSLLPILRNTMVGLQQVDDTVLEAGRGMGMGDRQVLWQLELPLAVPVILAGVRTALVINIGTAALAFILGGGGLGEVISQGYTLSRTPVLLTGAVLTAVLALLVDWIAGIVEEQLTPAGL